MTILDNATHRLMWLGRVHTLLVEVQRLEHHVSIGLLAQPTLEQRTLLSLADIALGVATRALLEAGDSVGRLK